jgi:hypothetical protein
LSFDLTGEPSEGELREFGIALGHLGEIECVEASIIVLIVIAKAERGTW